MLVLKHVKSVAREGGLVNARWAVACAIIALWPILLVGPGCSANKSSVTTSPDESVERAPPAGVAISEEKFSPENARLPKVAPGQGRQPLLPTTDYRIGPEDVLRVSVWDNRELTLDVTVRPDGKISIPLIRDVQAADLTATELADAILKQLLAFVKDPQVSIVVTQVNAPKIYVIGNVARPGPYPLRSEMSALQALSLAGGFTQFASPRSIKIVRGSGDRQEVRKMNFYDMIDDGGKGNYLLKAGDTLVIP
jgi:polysaccharide export outer membrane protein